MKKYGYNVWVFFLLSLLLACERSPLEQAGIELKGSSAQLRSLAALMPGDAQQYAQTNIELQQLHLLAYSSDKGLLIPAVTADKVEMYAMNFGVILAPAMNGPVESGDHEKLRAYFIRYASEYNQIIIQARQ